MGCISCSSAPGSKPKGCQSNGYCNVDSCSKLTVFNWLANMDFPKEHSLCPFVEVRFKNSRKSFYRFPENLSLKIGDAVIIGAENGYDVGVVTLTGELVRTQMKRKKVAPDSNTIGKILRIADQNEIDIWVRARNKEQSVQKRSREIAIALGLEMKLSDVEFRGDGKKATFYYTADKRIDFRQLIKDMAQAFSIRIEMRQVGLREEASRLGGIGSCGRELCCSTWLTDYRTVSIQAARYQQLSLNPLKLSGQCGKLKCCLNYELNAYRNALKSIPKTKVKLFTEKGVAVFQKLDIFKKILWYSYETEWTTWYRLSANSVNEIIAKNKAKKPVKCLEDFAEEDLNKKDNILFENTVGKDNHNRFDRQKNKTDRRKRKKRLQL